MHKVDPTPMAYHPYAAAPQQYYTPAPAGYYPPQPQYYQPMYTPQVAAATAAPQRIAPLNNPSGFTSTMTSSSSPSHQHYEAQPVVESSGRSEAEESDELTTSEAKAAIDNAGIVVQPKAVSWYPPVQQQYGPTYSCFTGPQDQQPSSYPSIQFNTVQTANQHPQYYSYQPQPPQTSAQPQPAQMEEAHKQLFAHLQALQQMQVKDAAMPAIVVPENYVAFNLSHLQARSPAAGDRSSRDGGSSPDRVAAAAAAMQPHHQIIPGMAHPLVIYPVGAMAEMQARAAAAAAAASVASGSAQNSSSSKKKRKDPNAPKNPLSAYLFFVTEQRTAMAQSNANVNGEKEPGAASTTTSFADVARELGQRWKSMTEEEKKPYLELAKKDKERYEAEKQAFGRKKVFIS